MKLPGWESILRKPVGRALAAILLVLAWAAAARAQPADAGASEVEEIAQQAVQLYDQGRYQEALPLAERALQIRKSVLGINHVDTAAAMHALARTYAACVDYRKAEEVYQPAIELRTKLLGSQHPDTLASTSDLGNVYADSGAFDKAERLLRQVLEARRQTLGPEHPETASSEKSLGRVYLLTGRYSEAKRHFQRALTIREKVLGADHAATITSLSDLARPYRELGNNREAEKLLLRALATREKVFGREHPNHVQALRELASLYIEMSSYDQAEVLLQRALAICEKVLGSEHRDTAAVLQGLAILYYETGAHSEAEALLERALRIFEATGVAEDRQTRLALSVLGAVYVRNKAYPQAERLYLRVLELQGRSQANPNNDAGVQLNLGSVYLWTGAYDKAESSFLRSLAIWEASAGPQHTFTAHALNNLAELYRLKGDYLKAEPLHLRSLAIREKSLGPANRYTIESLNSLGVLNWRMGALASALSYFQNAQGNLLGLSERSLRWGSEGRKQLFLERLSEDVFRYVSFSLETPGRASAALGMAGVLQYKGRVLDVVSEQVASLRESLDAADLQLLEQLEQNATELSGLIYAGASQPKDRKRTDELARQQEILEARIAKHSDRFQRQVAPVTLQAVGRNIPREAVLVELFRYRPFDVRAKTLDAEFGPPRYVAYVLDRAGIPIAIDLGGALPLEAAADAFRRALSDPQRSDVKQLAASLSEKLIAPLLPHLKGRRQLLLSPDGPLNLIPFAALLDERREFLVHSFDISYLTSGRDLLLIDAKARVRSPPVIIADPDFGQSRTSAELLSAGRRSTELDRGGLMFRSLPGTAVEAKSLKSLLELGDDAVLTGQQATESNLKRLRGPRILHVATHGFFLDDQQLAKLQSNDSSPASLVRENPLLRSGLALAGANARRSGENDDGILTALEAAQLDLDGTELVVLSACETGLGEVQNSEGVYGLRRAMVLSGAQAQISSLWRVEDTATRELMVDFYSRVLRGEGRSTSLRKAQRSMSAKLGFSHPYYWAGFVQVGNWKPLPPLR